MFDIDEMAMHLVHTPNKEQTTHLMFTTLYLRIQLFLELL